jgi:hypothetical protein
MLSCMLSVFHDECHKYALYAECGLLSVIMLSVVMPSVDMLSVVMLSVIMLSVVAPSLKIKRS